MNVETRVVSVLMADDDADDRMLAKDAWEETRPATKLDFVEDGEQLLDYLRHRGKYTGRGAAPLPNIILLDLNMPKKDGREVLREIKTDPLLKRIPVIVLTTSRAEEDIAKSYDLGVNSFIVKPARFEALVEVMRRVAEYWFGVVELPDNHLTRPN
jgi:CheY-like chemotaxis protein